MLFFTSYGYFKCMLTYGFDSYRVYNKFYTYWRIFQICIKGPTVLILGFNITWNKAVRGLRIFYYPQGYSRVVDTTWSPRENSIYPQVDFELPSLICRSLFKITATINGITWYKIDFTEIVFMAIKSSFYCWLNELKI